MTFACSFAADCIPLACTVDAAVSADCHGCSHTMVQQPVFDRARSDKVSSQTLPHCRVPGANVTVTHVAHPHG